MKKIVWFFYSMWLVLFIVPTANALTLQNGLANPYSAPTITGATTWINSSPLQLEALKGKVVLVDFWTYSCINCIRTLPYLKDWYSKYNKLGFIIIGIHSPEFEFEKNLDNVKNAVTQFGIKYPVALDNQFIIWSNFHNHYWPAHYLIDKNGKVVYEHFGEGDYAVTENNIRFLLGLQQAVGMPTGTEFISGDTTPETYLGFARSENFANSQTINRDQAMLYTFPEETPENKWALNGVWTVHADKVVAMQANVALKIHFNAQKVFIVMGNSTTQPIKVKVLLNGEPVVVGKGKDVQESSITVKGHRLYEVLDLAHFDSGILQLIPAAPGLEVYTFTFG